MGEDMTGEQKRYLEGFTSGLNVGRAATGLAPLRAAASGSPVPAQAPASTGPDAAALKAQARTETAGQKLVDQEKWKRTEHPFDAYARLRQQGADNVYPKPDDNFRWRYFGLFYVAPAQDSYMLRVRIPNGILTAAQMDGMAHVADTYGGGYSHITTRANLQVREIKAAHAAHVVEAVMEAGLTSRGSGADNIRNVTGSPTAGIDRQELGDTRPLARQWHYHILNDRSLFGLPRKFNVGFDGGGIVPVLEETNDIGFQAVEVTGEGDGIAPGIWYRLLLGGISGHRDLARDTGLICKPQDCTMVADTIIRVFIDTGDRTNRAKARLKYVLDSMGFDPFLAAVETRLGHKLTRIAPARIALRPPFDKQAHVGAHPQKQAGLNWIGVVIPVGRLSTAQMRGLAEVSRKFGDGDIRLTVWQNLLLSGVPDAQIASATAAIEALGLATAAHAIRAGLVACTGNKGCKFAASDTKGHALEIAARVESRLAFTQPVNIHLTGCHNSCAQHYIGDIGLIGARVAINDDGDTVEGYDIVVGGGFADNPRIGRGLIEQVKADDCPAIVERILGVWLAHRADASESFASFANRHETAQLKAMIGEAA